MTKQHSRDEKLPISAFIIVLNEAAKIGDCLISLSACAEIILVDCGSSDCTLEIAKRLADEGMPIKVFHQDWLGYSKQKQVALEKCRQPWCLSIDADERLDDALREELHTLISCDDEIVGWKVSRRGFLPGFGYPPAWVRERNKLRLIRNGAGRFDPNRVVHERIIATGKVKTAKKGSLLHDTPQLMDEQILKENKYSTLKADKIVQDNKPRNPFRLMISPPIYFFRLYILHGLWRCGFAGYIQAMTGAVYSFMTEAKVYQRRATLASRIKDDER